MIIYQATKREFLHDALRDDIEDVMSKHFVHVTGHRVGTSEMRAWASSLHHMAKVLGDDEIPDTAGVAIEYQVPQTAKRIDFLITGLDEARQPNTHMGAAQLKRSLRNACATVCTSPQCMAK